MLGIEASLCKKPRIVGLLSRRVRNESARSEAIFRMKRARGFTTVELVVTISITSVVFLAFLAILTNFFVVIANTSTQMDMTVSSQNLLRSTVDTLRVGGGVRQTNVITDPNAPPGGWNTSNSDFVIIIASPALDSDRDYIIDTATGSPYMNELVYYKSGDTLLQRALAHPDADDNSLTTSCPESLVSPGCPADKKLAEYINSMVFTLYDQGGNTTADPLLAKSVKIDLGMQRTSFGTTYTLDNGIKVTLRNRFQ